MCPQSWLFSLPAYPCSHHSLPCFQLPAHLTFPLKAKLLKEWMILFSYYIYCLQRQWSFCPHSNHEGQQWPWPILTLQLLVPLIFSPWQSCLLWLMWHYPGSPASLITLCSFFWVLEFCPYASSLLSRLTNLIYSMMSNMTQILLVFVENALCAICHIPSAHWILVQPCWRTSCML